MKQSIIIALTYSALVACAARPPGRISLVKTSSLTLSAPALGLVEIESTVFVASSSRIEVYGAGLLAATALPPMSTTWTSIAAVNALDGGGQWAVATDSHGDIWRVNADGEIIRITALFGVEGVRRIVSAGSTAVVLLDGGLGIIDGPHLGRYSLSGSIVAVSCGKLALATPDAVELWNLSTPSRVRFAIRGVKSLVFGNGTLLAATSDAVFAETSGGLQRIEVRGALASGVSGRGWLLTREGLFALQGSTRIPTNVEGRDVTALLGTDESLWLVRPGRLERYAAAGTAADDWPGTIAPLFRRACAGCHMPNGSAKVDLSSKARWKEHREAIYKRVVLDQTMPPDSTGLSREERSIVKQWLEATTN